MWGIWRTWHIWDEFAQHHASRGEWCVDAEDEVLTFATEAEAKRLAGLWNGISAGWTYEARRF